MLCQAARGPVPHNSPPLHPQTGHAASSRPADSSSGCDDPNRNLTPDPGPIVTGDRYWQSSLAIVTGQGLRHSPATTKTAAPLSGGPHASAVLPDQGPPRHWRSPCAREGVAPPRDGHATVSHASTLFPAEGPHPGTSLGWACTATLPVRAGDPAGISSPQSARTVCPTFPTAGDRSGPECGGVEPSCRGCR
jgi:hypothetical protein